MKEEYYKHLKQQGIEFIEYVGYGVEEWKRVQKATARNAQMGREVRFPIFDDKIPSEEVRRVISEEWGIKLPKAYEHLNHNNCIPCFKAGQKYWKVYYKHYPEQFNRAMEYEEKIGYTVFKGKTLKELKEKWDIEQEEKEIQVGLDELIPCECWV